MESDAKIQSEGEGIDIVDSSDSNASFLRAAKTGKLEKVIEYLNAGNDINAFNDNGLNALHFAAKENHADIVEELLKRGMNVDSTTKKKNTVLHIASLAGKDDLVKLLIERGASVNVQNQRGFTPLYMAAQNNFENLVKYLISHGADQNLGTVEGYVPLDIAVQQGHDKVVDVLLQSDSRGKIRLPALHIAAKKDNVKAASLLLQSDYNPDVTSKSGFTPLHIAAHYGNENIANVLLDKGADINFHAKHNITPLHVASKWGKNNMVELLISRNASLDGNTKDGLTPLHCAARSGHDQVVDLMLEKGAPITAKTKNGLAPLHMAAQGDHVDSARILLYHKAPVDDVTVDYLTALHVAAHYGHVRVAKLLLDRKADPNSRALNGFTPLHIACKKNRIKVVELLLKHGASIEATTESGLTPLHVAAFMGCMNIVIYLIQHGSNSDVPTVRGETALHLAARANQTDIIRILLRNGADVDARAREGQTPLHVAARLGNVDIVVLLLQHTAQVDATTKDMYTALHIAAKEGQEEVAAVLLDHGASSTATTKKGFTPLHLAAKYGNIKVARLLLQRDAPVDAQGKNGVTPLHVAAHYDNVNVALLLLEKGASPHATAKNGYSPLHIAAKKNQMDIATTLLEYGGKTNAESKAGFTPLHLASQEGHTDMSSLLIEHKGDVNQKSKNGLAPIHLCAQEDHVPVAEVLVKNDAIVTPPTNAGYTPLHVACHFGQINMVRFLLQQNADVSSTTSHGYTPLHQAAQQGHTLIINLLLEHRASPNAVTNQGQTALSIAQKLGYISVVETLKVVTETIVTTTTTTVTEEKYRVVAPETMQETFMSDSEEEGGDDFEDSAIYGKPTHAQHVYLPYYEGQKLREDAMLGDQTYHYLTVDEMKSLGDDSMPIDVTNEDRMEPMIQRDVLSTSVYAAPPCIGDDDQSPVRYPSQEAVFTATNYTPDNIDISRTPVHAGSSTIYSTDDDELKSVTSLGMSRYRFLVSFMVDARGGAMRGCRHSGVRVIVPPRKAPMPMRITCRYLKKDKLIHPPPLMEGEAVASRVLEMGPTGAKFLGPVIIEVPHFASLRGKEREITILRSDNGESWREHTLEASEEAIQEVLNESFEGEDLTALEDLNTNRITRILTTDFPQYFAVVTRIRQEVHAIGPEGGMVSSTVVPQVQAVFQEGALTKKIKVGLQAQPIPSELVAKMLGYRVAVSPIVTVEPRRRKFHKPITLTIPVPQASAKGMINQYSGDTPTLRLLCSITGGVTKAQWEDVTGSTPLTFVNDCVSFTTTVSARFWLMDCRQIHEATKYATDLYKEAIHIPFMAKFVVFAKRHDPMEARLSVFCMTDDKEDKTLEHQEKFIEVAKSRDVEVLEGKSQYLEFAGNLVPVSKSGEQLSLTFNAFKENRLPFIIRVKDSNLDPMGRVGFMREPKVSRGEAPQSPICNLNIALPDVVVPDAPRSEVDLVTLERKYTYMSEPGFMRTEQICKAELRLPDIAKAVGNDWPMLALQLDIQESDISTIKSNCPDDTTTQALVMLRLWMQQSGNKANGNVLQKALIRINREDIVNECMYNRVLVTDDLEKAVAKVQLDQSGFDAFKEELGSSRDASMKRETSLEVSYDEQDLMKEAESAEETSSDGPAKEDGQEDEHPEPTTIVHEQVIVEPEEPKEEKPGKDHDEKPESDHDEPTSEEDSQKFDELVMPEKPEQVKLIQEETTVITKTSIPDDLADLIGQTLDEPVGQKSVVIENKYVEEDIIPVRSEISKQEVEPVMSKPKEVILREMAEELSSFESQTELPKRKISDPKDLHLGITETCVRSEAGPCSPITESYIIDFEDSKPVKGTDEEYPPSPTVTTESEPSVIEEYQDEPETEDMLDYRSVEPVESVPSFDVTEPKHDERSGPQQYPESPEPQQLSDSSEPESQSEQLSDIKPDVVRHEEVEERELPDGTKQTETIVTYTETVGDSQLPDLVGQEPLTETNTEEWTETGDSGFVKRVVKKTTYTTSVIDGQEMTPEQGMDTDSVNGKDTDISDHQGTFDTENDIQGLSENEVQDLLSPVDKSFDSESESNDEACDQPIVTTPVSDRRANDEKHPVALDVTGDAFISEPSSGELSPVISEPDESSVTVTSTRKYSTPVFTELVCESEDTNIQTDELTSEKFQKVSSEVETVLTKPSPEDSPASEMSPEISPVVEYPPHLVPEMQVSVGLSPTELPQEEIVEHKESEVITQTTVHTTTHITETTFKDGAYDNDAFEGVENIDEPAELKERPVSPFEVERMDIDIPQKQAEDVTSDLEEESVDAKIVEEPKDHIEVVKTAQETVSTIKTSVVEKKEVEETEEPEKSHELTSKENQFEEDRESPVKNLQESVEVIKTTHETVTTFKTTVVEEKEVEKMPEPEEMPERPSHPDQPEEDRKSPIDNLQESVEVIKTTHETIITSGIEKHDVEEEKPEKQELPTIKPQEVTPQTDQPKETTLVEESRDHTEVIKTVHETVTTIETTVVEETEEPKEMPGKPHELTTQPDQPEEDQESSIEDSQEFVSIIKTTHETIITSSVEKHDIEEEEPEKQEKPSMKPLELTPQADQPEQIYSATEECAPDDIVWEAPIQEHVETVMETTEVIPREKQATDEKPDDEPVQVVETIQEEEKQVIIEEKVEEIIIEPKMKPPLKQYPSEISEEDLVEPLREPEGMEFIKTETIEEEESKPSTEIEYTTTTTTSVVTISSTLREGEPKSDPDDIVDSDITPEDEVPNKNEKTQVVMRRKKTENVEIVSSSGESHYYSFDTESGRSSQATTGTSRPTSSEFDPNVAGHPSSEYETCVTSQETTGHSSYNTPHTTDASYITPASSFTQSSRDSTISVESESSGHLASLELSEASETLVPSAVDLHEQLRESATPSPSEDDTQLRFIQDEQLSESLIQSIDSLGESEKKDEIMEKPDSPFEMISDSEVAEFAADEPKQPDFETQEVTEVTYVQDEPTISSKTTTITKSVTTTKVIESDVSVESGSPKPSEIYEEFLQTEESPVQNITVTKTVKKTVIGGSKDADKTEETVTTVVTSGDEDLILESELKDLDSSRPDSKAESFFSRSDSDQRPYSELQFSDERPDSEIKDIINQPSDGKDIEEFERPPTPEPPEEIPEKDSWLSEPDVAETQDTKVVESIKTIETKVTEIQEGASKPDDEPDKEMTTKGVSTSYGIMYEPHKSYEHDKYEQTVTTETNIYNYSMNFERNYDEEEMYLPNENLPPVQEEEIYDVDYGSGAQDFDDQKLDFETRSTPESDIVGRRIPSRSGQSDAGSVSSLQEFEKFEQEVSTRKSSSSHGSSDSLNERQPVRASSVASSDHEDISASSLTEFEKLERQIVQVEKTEKDIMQLSEIEEGHESQASDSQETISEGAREDDTNGSEDYDKRAYEIDEIIRQAQSNVEKFDETLPHIPLENLEAKASSSESSLIDKTPAGREPDADSLNGGDIPELDMDQGEEGKAVEDVEEDSLHDDHAIIGDVPRDTAQMHDIDEDSLKEEKVLLQEEVDSLQGDDDKDSLLEDVPEQDSLLEDDRSVDSLLDEDEVKELPDDINDDSLKEEAIAIDTSSSGREYDVAMITSTSSMERSSSAATHATYQYETDSIMSSSVQSAEGSTMMSSTDTLEPEMKGHTLAPTSFEPDVMNLIIEQQIDKSLFDSEGNICTDTMKTYTDQEGNVDNVMRTENSTMLLGQQFVKEQLKQTTVTTVKQIIERESTPTPSSEEDRLSSSRVEMMEISQTTDADDDDQIVTAVTSAITEHQMPSEIESEDDVSDIKDESKEPTKEMTEEAKAPKDTKEICKEVDQSPDEKVSTKVEEFTDEKGVKHVIVKKLIIRKTVIVMKQGESKPKDSVEEYTDENGIVHKVIARVVEYDESQPQEEIEKCLNTKVEDIPQEPTEQVKESTDEFVDEKGVRHVVVKQLIVRRTVKSGDDEAPSEDFDEHVDENGVVHRIVRRVVRVSGPDWSDKMTKFVNQTSVNEIPDQPETQTKESVDEYVDEKGVKHIIIKRLIIKRIVTVTQSDVPSENDQVKEFVDDDGTVHKIVCRTVEFKKDTPNDKVFEYLKQVPVENIPEQPESITKEDTKEFVDEKGVKHIVVKKLIVKTIKSVQFVESEPCDDVEEFVDDNGVVRKIVRRTVVFSGNNAVNEMNEYIDKAPVEEIPEEPEVQTKETREEFVDNKGVKHVVIKRLIVKRTIICSSDSGKPVDCVEESTDDDGVVHKVVRRVVEFGGPDAMQKINEYIEKAPVDQIPDKPEILSKEVVSKYVDENGVKHEVVKRLIVKKSIIVSSSPEQIEPKDEVEELKDPSGVVRKIIRRVVEFSGPDAENSMEKFMKDTPAESVPEEPEVQTKETVEEFVDNNGVKNVVVKRLIVKKTVIVHSGVEEHEPKDDVEKFTSPDGTVHILVKRTVEFSGPHASEKIDSYLKETSVSEIPSEPAVQTKESVTEYIDKKGIKHVIVRRLIIKKSVVTSIEMGEPQPTDSAEETVGENGEHHKVISRVVEFSGPDAADQIEQYLEKVKVDEIPEEPEVLTKESVKEYTDNKGVKNIVVRRLVVRTTEVVAPDSCTPLDDVNEVTDSDGVVHKIVRRVIEFGGPKAKEEMKECIEETNVDEIPEEPEALTKETVKEYTDNKGVKNIVVKRLIVRTTKIVSDSSEPKDDVNEVVDSTGVIRKVVRRVVCFHGPNANEEMKKFIKEAPVDDIPEEPEVLTKESTAKYTDNKGVKYVVVKRLVVKTTKVVSINSEPMDDVKEIVDSEGVVHKIVRRVMEFNGPEANEEMKQYIKEASVDEIPEEPEMLTKESVKEFTDEKGVKNIIVKRLVVRTTKVVSENSEPIYDVDEVIDSDGVVHKVIRQVVEFSGPEANKEMKTCFEQSCIDDIPEEPDTITKEIKNEVIDKNGLKHIIVKRLIVKRVITKLVGDDDDEPIDSVNEFKDNDGNVHRLVRRTIEYSGNEGSKDMNEFVSKTSLDDIPNEPEAVQKEEVEEVIGNDNIKRIIVRRLIVKKTVLFTPSDQAEPTDDLQVRENEDGSVTSVVKRTFEVPHTATYQEIQEHLSRQNIADIPQEPKVVIRRYVNETVDQSKIIHRIVRVLVVKVVKTSVYDSDEPVDSLDESTEGQVVERTIRREVTFSGEDGNKKMIEYLKENKPSSIPEIPETITKQCTEQTTIPHRGACTVIKRLVITRRNEGQDTIVEEILDSNKQWVIIIKRIIVLTCSDAEITQQVSESSPEDIVVPEYGTGPEVTETVEEYSEGKIIYQIIRNTSFEMSSETAYEVSDAEAGISEVSPGIKRRIIRRIVTISQADASNSIVRYLMSEEASIFKDGSVTHQVIRRTIVPGEGEPSKEYFDEDGNKHCVIRRAESLESLKDLSGETVERHMEDYMVQESITFKTSKTVRKNESDIDTTTLEEKEVTTYTPAYEAYSALEGKTKVPEFISQAKDQEALEHILEETSSKDDESCTMSRTVTRHVIMGPQIETVHFSGEEAETKMQSYFSQIQTDKDEDVEEYEETDEDGNVHKIKRQVIVQPEVRTVTFSGPDAQKQLEEFLSSMDPEVMSAADLSKDDSCIRSPSPSASSNYAEEQCDDSGAQSATREHSSGMEMRHGAFFTEDYIDTREEMMRQMQSSSNDGSNVTNVVTKTTRVIDEDGNPKTITETVTLTGNDALDEDLIFKNQMVNIIDESKTEEIDGQAQQLLDEH